jgi:hypothetical protein
LPAELVTHPPEIGSKIIEADDTEWTVLSVGHETLKTRWRCTCRNLIVANRLNTLVTIQYATETKGSGGALEPTWANIATDVRARIQPISATTLVEYDRRRVETAARITLQSPLNYLPDRRYRVVDSDSRIYSVLGYEQEDRVDVLPVIIAERGPSTYVGG